MTSSSVRRESRDCGRLVDDGPHALLGPATSEDAPVGLAEVGVTQGIQHWVYGAVDVTQPVS